MDHPYSVIKEMAHEENGSYVVRLELFEGETAWMPGTTKYMYRAHQDGAKITYRGVMEGDGFNPYAIETSGVHRAYIEAT